MFSAAFRSWFLFQRGILGGGTLLARTSLADGLGLVITTIDAQLLALLAKSAFVLLVEAFHVLGKEKGAALAVDASHRFGLGEGVEMDDIAGVAGEFPVGEDRVLATLFAKDSLMGVASAVGFGDVFVAFEAEKLVLAGFGDLPEGHDPGLTSFRRAGLAELRRVGPRVDAGPLVTAKLTLEEAHAAATAFVRSDSIITLGLAAARLALAQCHNCSPASETKSMECFEFNLRRRERETD